MRTTQAVSTKNSTFSEGLVKPGFFGIGLNSERRPCIAYQDSLISIPDCLKTEIVIGATIRQDKMFAVFNLVVQVRTLGLLKSIRIGVYDNGGEKWRKSA